MMNLYNLNFLITNSTAKFIAFTQEKGKKIDFYEVQNKKAKSSLL